MSSPRLGWKYIGEKKVRKFGKLSGRWRISLLCNGEVAATVFTTVQDEAWLGYTYSLSAFELGHVFGLRVGRSGLPAGPLMSQARLPAFGTRIRFFNNTAEGRIDPCGIVDAVVDLHGVMVHLSAAFWANHLSVYSFFVSCYVEVFNPFQNIIASSRAMPR